MHALQLIGSVGVVGVVFGLSALVAGVIVVTLLWAPAHDADDRLHGWVDLTCPATRHSARVRLAANRTAGVQRLDVVRCSRYDGKRPPCRMACLLAERRTAVA